MANTQKKPTGDIKIFVDKFNSELDKVIKELDATLLNLKNIYSDAIKVSTPRSSTWPKDDSVKTIGDLFKYTFPDINTNMFIKPPNYVISNGVSSYIDSVKKEDYDSWQKDLTSTELNKLFFKSIKSGLNAKEKLDKLNNSKKSGITNPDLYSPGQYYFDVFMSQLLRPYGPIFSNSYINNFAKKKGLSASISLFSKSGDKEINKLSYTDFSTYILPLGRDTELLTGIDAELRSNESDGFFSGLRTPYRSGLISVLEKDPTFDIERGEKSSLFPDQFSGYYEQMLLYKAMIQAGDDYKSIVLPYRDNKPESTPDLIVPTLPITKPDTQELTFNVEKKDTFIVVGGTVSPPLELVIVPNDGTEYIFEAKSQVDELSEEYAESDFVGTDEDIWTPPTPNSYPTVNTELLNKLKGVDPVNSENLSTSTDSKYKTSKDKDANIKQIIAQAKKAGVTNKYAIGAILAIISKESGFVPQGETSYRGTSGARCIKIFGSRGKTAEQWEDLTKNDKNFFDFVYGGQYGNASNEGYKYRGRGFNQITFKGNYQTYAKNTGYDIVNNPDLLNTVEVAAACAIDFFKTNIKYAPSWAKKQYNFTDINSFTSLDSATGAIYHCNAGFGNTYNQIIADSTGGRKKAFENAGPIFNTYSSEMA